MFARSVWKNLAEEMPLKLHKVHALGALFFVGDYVGTASLQLLQFARLAELL